MTWTPPSLESLYESLNSPSNPIGMRMRAAYYLRQAHDNHVDDRVVQKSIISTLGSNLRKADHGSLMRHEFAYVMGQLRDVLCCPYLEEVLSREDDCVMVRHECSEALGAIGNVSSIAVLEKFVEDFHPEVSETCRIAVDFIRWKLTQETGAEGIEKGNNSGGDNNDLPPVMACACMLSPYNSVDPAPPLSDSQAKIDAVNLGRILRDDSISLFERYRAMFTLRNMNTAQSATELGNVLIADTSSALLRHEIAYVLGQMQNEASIPMLIQSLTNEGEHVMVRHESAEALGAMCDLGGTYWEECEKVLQDFQSDEVVAVAESCQVALDAADYWGVFNSNLADAEEEDCEQGPATTFGAHKALSCGDSSCGSERLSKAAVLSSHFNVASTKI